MRLLCCADPIDRLAVDTACVSFHADERPLRDAAGLVDWRLCGQLSRLILQGTLTGQFGEKLLVHPGGRLVASRLLVLGAGRKASFHFPQLDQMLRDAFEALLRMRVASAAMPLLGATLTGLETLGAATHLVEALATFKREAQWLDAFSLTLVAPERRLTELFGHLDQIARDLSWLRMDGKRYRPLEERAAAAAR